MRGGGRRVVIDADVAEGAGTTDHPRSRLCRQFLEAVRTNRVRLALSEDLEREWRRHASSFTRRWLATMVSRGRVVRLDPDPVELDEAVSEAISVGTLIPECAGRVEKDMHIVEAALTADRLVASLDEKVRRCFRDLACSDCGWSVARDIGRVVWVNPEHPEPDAIDWAKAGCPYREDLRLRSN